MKRVTLIILFLLLNTTITIAESITLEKENITTNYEGTSTLEGTITLTLKNVETTTPLTFNKQHIAIRNLLEKTNKEYTCKPESCISTYETTGTEQTTKTLTLKEETPQHLGLLIKGKTITNIKNIALDIKSNFKESETIPLTLQFFEGEEQQYKTPGTKRTTIQGSFSNGDAKADTLLKTSTYCQAFTIPETGILFAGAWIEKKGNEKLTMSLYNNKEQKKGKECTYNPQTEEGCSIDLTKETINFEEEHYICIQGTNTEHKLESETQGNTKGKVLGYLNEESTKDYGIRAEATTFAEAKNLNDIIPTSLEEKAETYLQQHYNNNCEEECILPITITGIPQEFTIENINIEYQARGDKEYNKITTITKEEPELDFEGTITLKEAAFEIEKSGTYKLTLGSETLTKKEYNVNEELNIKGLSPLTAPAGIPIIYYLDVEGTTSSTTYEWVIGTTTKTTTKPELEYGLDNLGITQIKVTGKTGTTTTPRKTFNIEVVIPEEAINETLQQKEEELQELQEKIATYNKNIQTTIKETLQLTTLEQELQNYKTTINNANKTQLPQIAKTLYQLQIPKQLGTTTLLEKQNLNDITIITEKTLGTTKTTTEQKKAIENWNNNNIEITGTTTTYHYNKEGRTIPIITHHTINARSYQGEEGYLILQGNNNITFITTNNKETTNKGYIIPLTTKTTTIELTTNNNIQYYTAPNLATIITQIEETCNYNNICEKEYGENSKTCRNDCKPTTTATIYYIGALLTFIILYTILQVWYKHNYEQHLFNNKKELYNLLMYITNAKTQNKTNSEIYKELTNKGWTKEKVTYTIKKSEGKNTGLPEIIPIEKILAKKRRKKALQQTPMNTPQPMTRPPRPQLQGNINKQQYQRPRKTP